MRTYDEIMSTARDEAPFSNGTEGFGWMENWCWRCHNPAELAWRRYEEGKRKMPPTEFPGGCPLMLVALQQKTPTEWIDQWKEGEPYPIDRFHCIEFRGPDDGRNGEPRPKRDPTGMDGLFPCPERRVRMLKQPETQRELVTA